MADVEIDFSGTRQLFGFVEQFNEKYDDFLDGFITETGSKALRETKKATPVGEYYNDAIFWARKSKTDQTLNLVELEGVGEGMVGGTLRNAWKMTGVRRNGQDRQVAVYADSQIAPYAVYVEYGHESVWFNNKPPRHNRWIAGKFMARDSMMNVHKKIPRSYQVKFSKFIRSLGVTNV